MELLSGETLSARLRRGPLTPAEALDVGEDLLAALGALHDAGLVHRDLKPSNIFLTAHGGKLARLRPRPGAAGRRRAALVSTTDVTRPGLIVGTPGYMAPEQILGKAGGRAGRPLRRRAPSSTRPSAAARRSGGTTPSRRFRHALRRAAAPHRLARARGAGRPVRRALAKKPAERYASARGDGRGAAAAPRGAAEAGTAPARARRSSAGRRSSRGWTSASRRPPRGRETSSS